MSLSHQHTLVRPAFLEGLGIHSGRSVRVAIQPAPAHSGIRFLRTDLAGASIAAHGGAVCETRLGTVIGNDRGVTVATIEHLMATLCALAIDNVVVELDGPEVPIMDGSCQPFLTALDKAGRRQQDARRRYIEILEPIAVRDGDKRASLGPASGFEVAFEIAFDDPAIGRQRIDLAVEGSSFRDELADSRTFGFLHEVEALRAAGLARGGSLDNAVVVENGAVLNPEGLRRPDEFVRHKAVDAIGDLYLLGAPLIGRYEAIQGGHALNNALVRAVLGDPRAWAYAFAPEALARAAG